MSFIFIDNEKHRLIDVLEDRKQQALKQYFMSHPLEVRKQVETITMDMYTPYLTLIPKLFQMHVLLLINFILYKHYKEN